LVVFSARAHSIFGMGGRCALIFGVEYKNRCSQSQHDDAGKEQAEISPWA